MSSSNKKAEDAKKSTEQSQAKPAAEQKVDAPITPKAPAEGDGQPDPLPVQDPALNAPVPEAELEAEVESAPVATDDSWMAPKPFVSMEAVMSAASAAGNPAMDSEAAAQGVVVTKQDQIEAAQQATPQAEDEPKPEELDGE